MNVGTVFKPGFEGPLIGLYLIHALVHVLSITNSLSLSSVTSPLDIAENYVLCPFLENSYK